MGRRALRSILSTAHQLDPRARALESFTTRAPLRSKGISPWTRPRLIAPAFIIILIIILPTRLAPDDLMEDCALIS